MLKQYGHWFIAFFTCFLISCGEGGGSLERGDSLADDDVYTLSLSAVDQQGQVSNQTSQNNPLTVRATVTENGLAASGVIVNFSTDVGSIEPASGSVLAQNGVATVLLYPGNVESAGTLTASISGTDSDVSDTLDFSSLGDGSNPDTGVTVNADLYFCSETLADDVSNLSQCTQTRKIYGEQSVYLISSVTSDGTPVRDTLVSLNVNESQITTVPVSGELLTNDSGYAIFELTGESDAGNITIGLSAEGVETNVENIDSSQFAYNLSSKILQCDLQFDASSDDFGDCQPITSFYSSSAKYYLYAKVTEKRSGEAVSGVQLSARSVAGNLLFESGTTNEHGLVTFETGVPEDSGSLNVSVVGNEGLQSLIAYTVPDKVYGLTLNLVNAQGNVSQALSQSNPLTAVATLTVNGQPAANEVLNFEARLAALNVSASLTDQNGQAQLTLLATDVEGAGGLTVSYEQPTTTLADTVSFYSQGDGKATAQAVTLTGTFYRCAENASPTVEGIETSCQSQQQDATANDIFNTQPIYLLVEATQQPESIPYQNQVISAETELATLSQSSALTTDSGKVIFRLTGAGQRGANSVVVSSGESSAIFNYQVSTEDQPSNNTSVYSVSLGLFDEDGAEFGKTDGVYVISADNPAIAKATIYKNGKLIPLNEQYIVQFDSSGVGVLSPSSGVDVSNDQGEAEIVLRAGNVITGGEITATALVPSGEVVSNGILFETLGDDVSIVPDQYKLSIRAINVKSGDTTFSVSKDEPVELIATLTDNNDQAVENALLSFSTSLGSIYPEIATARTDAEGKGRVTLTAGDVKGAGQAQVSYQDAVAFVTFDSAGDEIKQDKAFTLSADVYDCTAEDANKETAENCILNNQVRLNSPRTVIVRVTDNGVGIGNLLVNIETDNGTINPASGRVLTNANGYAYADISMSEISGAGLVTVTLPTSTASGSATTTVDIGAVDIVMGNEDDNGEFKNEIIARDIDGSKIDILQPGRTAILEVNIIDAESGQPYLQPVEVNFSSACASTEPATARLDSTVTAYNGVARAIYVADGCINQDQILATADAGTRSLTATGTIELGDVPADSIVFESVEIDGEVVTDNPTIGLKGNGAQEKARLNFKVFDQFGNAKPGQTIRFSLANSIGDTTGLGGVTLSPSEAVSFTDGSVFVTVESGRVANPIVVIAELIDESGDVQASGVSRSLAAITGIGDQNSTAFVAESLNIEAWGIAGVENKLTLFLADHNNHPVLDGTSAVFRTDTGMIDGSCTTLDGVCVVNWKSSNPVLNGNDLINGFCDVGNDNDPSNDIPVDGKPCFGPVADTDNDGDFDSNDVQGPLQIAHPRQGRVSVLAYSKGEESFVDANANGIYDAGETFYNLGEAFLDDNADGLFCGQQNESSPMPAPAGPATAFDIDNIVFAPGVEQTLCIKTASYGVNAGENYIYLGAADEEFIDLNNDGQFNPELDENQHLFNGLSCTVENENNGICSRNLVHIRDGAEFVTSGQTAYVRVLDSNNQEVNTVYLNADTFTDCNGNGVWDASVNETVIGADCNNDGDQFDTDVAEPLIRDNNGNGRWDASHTEILSVYITDVNNNPMPAGTSVTFNTDNGVLIGSPNSEFLETASLLPSVFSVGLKPESDGNEVFTGNLTLTVSTGNDVTTNFNLVTVIDSQ
ncbi:Ig-like domain-containing protein [Gayadomonas joobiniege]|uniref:Ig-like domain-containing protein n=1 Tax=Gayadomonas joobiniege TaxID=1234606 RepID=UPI000365C387|nr:Ig-like domain-containing protein [Gayadomonas joobiniege]